MHNPAPYVFIFLNLLYLGCAPEQPSPDELLGAHDPEAQSAHGELSTVVRNKLRPDDDTGMTTVTRLVESRPGFVKVEVAMRNVGRADRQIRVGNPYATFVLAVYDRLDHPVPLTKAGQSRMENPILGPRTAVWLAPGQEHSYGFDLARLFDLARPGRYRLVVSEKLRWDGKRWITRPAGQPLDFDIPPPPR